MTTKELEMDKRWLKELFFVFVTAIISVINFNCNDVEEGGKDGWDYDEITIDSACSMYIEYAPKGKYFFNISTMDSCNNLNTSKYLEGYKTLLERYSNKLISNKGIITFQTSFTLSNYTLFTNKLINIKNRKFHTNSETIKIEKFAFVIEAEKIKK